MLPKQYIRSTIYSLLFLSITHLGYSQTGCTIGDCENGKGRFIYKNGDKYIGEFKNAVPHGRGAYYNKDGSLYKGPFVNGKRQGYGTFIWTNGEKYIGEYKNNMRHGEGIYTFSDGTQQKGIWRDGTFVEEIAEKKTEIVAATPSNDPFGANPDEDQYDGKFFKALTNIDSSQARTALIIGNSYYQKAPLKNPVNDAIAMAEELQRSGFDAYVYTDLKQKTMKKAIREFGEILKERGGVGLFFYAGHGLQSDGRNFLVPVDAVIAKIQDIEFESVDLGRVLSEFEYAENDMNIIILDACRDNPYKEEFKKSKHASYNGLASIGSAPYNSFIAFSTAPGSVALDGKGVNGLYTQELLKAMSQKGPGLEDVFKQVRKNVRKSSEGRQIPWESSSVEDDFYFKH
ncbi:caspase family protein [Aureispira anguillae]|uniref:Caspase family protein n=1 Tax=Aureispira anguillae TaxID=2864201 RepID=A0A916DQ64_9BACT|nr:caspase family protein [Aureispira anguillae]BDS10989.1 caspase family protein [Aureispira anguillae]